MSSQKNNWLSNLTHKYVSTFTGFVLLFSSLIISTYSMPEPTDERETVLLTLLSTSVQKVEIPEPRETVDAFRIKVLTKKLAKLEAKQKEKPVQPTEEVEITVVQ